MTSESMDGGDHQDQRAWLLTGVDADFWEPGLGDGHTEVDSVVVTLSGADPDGVPRSQRFVVPTDSWDDVYRHVRQVIRSQEMGRAIRAASLLDTVEDRVFPDDPWAEFDDYSEDEDEDDEDVPGEDDEGFTPAEIDAAWADFGPRLVSVLEALEPGHVLALTAPTGRFVQLVVERRGARIETVGNQFLPSVHHMTFEDLEVLAAAGWNPPTHFAEEAIPRGASPNHHRHLPEDWSRTGTAELIVTVLRTLHHVEVPSDLTYGALALRQGQILLPTLGIPRRQPSER